MGSKNQEIADQILQSYLEKLMKIQEENCGLQTNLFGISTDELHFLAAFVPLFVGIRWYCDPKLESDWDDVEKKIIPLLELCGLESTPELLLALEKVLS